MESKYCIGIISYFPDNQEIRDVRLQRLKNLLDRCSYVMPNIPYLIIAQNWDDSLSFNNAIIYHYDKLGITGAREELRKRFLDTDYDLMICLDDDFLLTSNRERFKNYLDNVANNYNKCIVECENYLMNMCIMSKYIASHYSFDSSISAEKGTGFEDWIYISVIKKNDPNHYKQFWKTGLIAKPRKEMVNDKYSTWLNSSVDKDLITEKSSRLISQLTKQS